MAIGESYTRVDAFEKVTGGAKYTDDLLPPDRLTAKIVRSAVANGIVKRMDLTKALAVPGVVRIATCFDAPDIQFPTPGHPWSVEESHQDVADRRMLNRRVRIYGDDIAAVIAEDSVAAARAARLVEVEYEEFPALTTVDEAMAPGAPVLHDEYPGNVLKHTSFEIGDYGAAAIDEEGLRVFEGVYETQMAQHCHLELPVCCAYMEGDRVVVVSSTQIPHIVRRVIGQANGWPWGRVRVIKPYIGGGFGNKQEVLYEPLCAFLTMLVGGRPVEIELSREETFYATRTRHSIRFHMRTAVRPDGRLVSRRLTAYANQGGYASHGHAIVANSVNAYRHLYQDEKALKCDAYTVYTNLPSGGAMRGYGIPQIVFAMESHMDDIARGLGMDPVALRLKNCMRPGYVDPMTGITCHSSGLRECIEKGKEWIRWEEKRAAYAGQTGDVRRGVGMAIFSYKTGVYPISLETASARLVLNQDGSAQLQMGATEIGQGADTVFVQMAAETSGLRVQDIHIVSTQDTDVAPFDTGAYASRQTYVSGMAIRKTAEAFKARILDYAAGMLERPADELDIRESRITDRRDGGVLLDLADVAMEAFYSLAHAVHITAEESIQCKDNTFAFGACFAEVEVDIPVGKVKVLNIVNVHDSGTVINPALARAQVHGGMSMGLGYALSEQLLFDGRARPLNANLLDYKLPTSMDTPELGVEFVLTEDPSGPYGNKALGEPPAIPPAPAIRNAVLNATGVAVDSLPLNPQRLAEKFAEAGLIRKGGGGNV